MVHADWRWLNRDVHGTYDAIICLGNSFTHLFSERDRRKALAEFYAMLNHNGVLIIDQRNYDALLDGKYGNKHTYYYCGEEVSAEPEHVDEGLARFVYRFPDKSEYHLNMFPLRKDYTRRLLREVGFQQVDTYGDFQETYQATSPTSTSTSPRRPTTPTTSSPRSTRRLFRRLGSTTTPVTPTPSTTRSGAAPTSTSDCIGRTMTTSPRPAGAPLSAWPTSWS
ncbi:class I SAM-dependent methyltransferase [Allosalinactinospora lopnorensis]|uniref:class I SAM-dependent methyltransferase n=1 Tax=Allosalinactinospora lopnorensis TaxID=1352348 RepID=UPI000A69F527|nr:class I SAM-dependent methyltransferase [Allosalinactinospora lopnorensis]